MHICKDLNGFENFSTLNYDNIMWYHFSHNIFKIKPLAVFILSHVSVYQQINTLNGDIKLKYFYETKYILTLNC